MSHPFQKSQHRHNTPALPINTTEKTEQKRQQEKAEKFLMFRESEMIKPSDAESTLLAPHLQHFIFHIKGKILSYFHFPSLSSLWASIFFTKDFLYDQN